MSLEPVTAAARTAAVRAAAPGAQDRRSQDPAVTLRLVLGAAAAGQRMAHGDEGRVYRFGAGEGLPSWREGQTVLVQVLRTGPPLEVKVLGVLAPEDSQAGAGLADVDPPAVRPDQAAILRLAAASTDTMAQAAHWRQLTLAALLQAATVGPAHSSMAGTDQDAPASTGRDAALLLRVLPWHGHPLTLWLEQRRWTGGPNRRARRRAGTRLCLAVDLGALGPVALMLDVLDVQVGLTVSVLDASSVAALRGQVGAMAARMARAGLRLMRCHVRHDPVLQVPAPASAAPSIGSHELPLALFRAGAEAMEALRRTTERVAH